MSAASFYDSTKDFLVNAVIFQQNGRHVTYVCLTAKENVKAFFFILRLCLWASTIDNNKVFFDHLNFRAKIIYQFFLMKMYCDVINWQNISLTCFYYITASKWIFGGCLNSVEEKCWQTIWRRWRMLYLLFYPSWIHLSNAQSGLSHMQEKIPFRLSLQMVFH